MTFCLNTFDVYSSTSKLIKFIIVNLITICMWMCKNFIGFEMAISNDKIIYLAYIDPTSILWSVVQEFTICNLHCRNRLLSACIDSSTFFYISMNWNMIYYIHEICIMYFNVRVGSFDLNANGWLDVLKKWIWNDTTRIFNLQDFLGWT